SSLKIVPARERKDNAMRVAKANNLQITGKCCRLRWIAGLIAILVASAADAGDWPQILGPHRNGKADGEQLVAWGKSGPTQLWSRDVGEGFSGMAVAGERGILFHRPGAELVAEALEGTTGKSLWQTKFDTRFRGSISP